MSDALKPMLTALLAWLAFQGSAQAATFAVTEATDAVDANPGDGVCQTALATCTLRAAVQESNALPGKDTILLAAATYTLSLGTGDDDAGALGDLDLLDDVDIKGAGVADTILDGNSLFRIFDCAAGVRAYTLPRMAARISHLTMQHGNASVGGAVQVGCHLELNTVRMRDNTALDGGAIYAVGDTFDFTLESADARLVVTHVELLRNRGSIGVGGMQADNAKQVIVRDGLFESNQGSFAGAFSVLGATIVDSTFDGNSGLLVATGNDLDLERSAFVDNIGNNGMLSVGGTSLVSNTTFSENAAKFTSAVFNHGTMEVDNVTFVGNFALSGGAAFTSSNGNAATLANTLFVLNHPQSCTTNAALTSLGFNVATDATCSMSAMGDQPNVSSNAADLTLTFPSTSSDGFTPFHGLPASSVARDAGNPAPVGSSPAACEVDDQRHVSRPAPGGTGSTRGDVGAFEACTSAADPTDTDFDGRVDACDGDDDNDGCPDGDDQHPKQAAVVAGPVKNFCGGADVYHAFEGNDTDGDGRLDCEDDDDDDDGTLDGDDGCRVEASNVCLRLGTPRCLPSWFDCFGGSCVELVLKFVSVINPERLIRFEHFTVVDGNFYLQPLAGLSAVESVAALGKAVEAKATAVATKGAVRALSTPGAATDDTYRMEIWTRDTRETPGRRVAVVTQYQPSQNRVRSLGQGQVIRIDQPTSEKSVLTLSTTWSVASAPKLQPDLDRDGVPDAFDNCRWVANREQTDLDRNGRGDQCDGDR